MTDTLAAVRFALRHLASAWPYNRARRLRELLAAGVVLNEETTALHYWLVRAWDWLDTHPDHKDFAEREDRLLMEIQRYQAMHALLGEALVTIGKEERGCPAIIETITPNGDQLSGKSRIKPITAVNSAAPRMERLFSEISAVNG